MGVISVPGQSGRTYSVRIAGDAPTPEEQSRIDAFLAQQEAGSPFYSPPSRAVPAEEGGGFFSSLGTAVGVGADQLQQGYGSALEGLGSSLGIEGLRTYGKSVAEANAKEAEEGAQKLTGRDDVDGLGSALSFYGETLAQQFPQLAVSLAGGWAGAKAGGAAGAAFSGVGAFPGAIIGGVIGGAAANIPYFYGSNRERQKEAIERGYRVEMDEGAAFLSSIPQASLDAIVDRFMIGKVLSPSVIRAGGLFTRAVKGGAAGALAEVPTEIGQAVIERFQAGLPVDDEEAIREYEDVAIAAGLVGGTVGGVASASAGDIRKKREKEREEKGQIELDLDQKALGEEAGQRINYGLNALDRVASGEPPSGPVAPTLALPSPRPSDPTQGAAPEAPAPSQPPTYGQDAMDVAMAKVRAAGKYSAPAIQNAIAKETGTKVPMSVVRNITADMVKGGVLIPDAKASGGFRVQKVPENNFSLSDDLQKTLKDLDQSIEKDRLAREQAVIELRRLQQMGGTPKKVREAATLIDRLSANMAKSEQTKQEVTQRLATADKAVQVPTQERPASPISGTSMVMPITQATPEAQKKAVDDRVATMQTSLAQREARLKAASAQIKRLEAEKKKGPLPTAFTKQLDDLKATVAEDKFAIQSLKDEIKNPAPAIEAERRAAEAAQVRERAAQAATAARTPVYTGQQQKVFNALRKRLANLGLSDVRLVGERVIMPDLARQGKLVEGTFDVNDGNRVIAVALSVYDPKMSDQQLFEAISEVMNHEVIHALKNLGVFTDAEWKVLSDLALRQKYMQRQGGKAVERNYTYFDRAKRMYASSPREIQIEEAVAEMFRDYAAGRLKVGGRPRSLMERIKAFFRAIWKSHEDVGLTDPNAIFEGIRFGDIGKRERKPANDNGAARTSKAAEPPKWVERFSSVNSPEFQQWFHQAKTKTPDGGPMRVYHATRFKDEIEAFLPMTHFGTSRAANDRVANTRMWRDDPSDEKVYPLYIALKNPLDVGKEQGFSGGGAWADDFDTIRQVQRVLGNKAVEGLELDDSGEVAGFNKAMSDAALLLREIVANAEGREHYEQVKRKAREAAAQVLLDLGYDGITYTNIIEDPGSTSYIILKPQSVKSVFNTGTFRPDNPDIRFSSIESEAFKKWFGKSQVLNDDGTPKEVYHGTTKAGFFIFDTEPDNWKTKGTGAFFTDDSRNARTYSGTNEMVKIPSRAAVLDNPGLYGFDVREWFGEVTIVDPDGYEVTVPGVASQYDDAAIRPTLEQMVDDWLTSDRIGEEHRANYDVYLKIENPFVYDAKGRMWNELGEEEVFTVVNEHGDIVDYAYDEWTAESLLDQYREDFPNGTYEIKSEMRPGQETTDEIVRMVREMNYGSDTPYDGVIFKNIDDSGSEAYGSYEGEVYVVFKPEQIKSVRNYGDFNPKSKDIRYSAISFEDSASPAELRSMRQAQSLALRFASVEAYKPILAPVKNRDGQPTHIFGRVMDGDRPMTVFLTEGEHKDVGSGTGVGFGMAHIKARHHDVELLNNSKYETVEQAIFDLMKRWEKQGYTDGTMVQSAKTNDGIELFWTEGLTRKSPPLRLALWRHPNGSPIMYVKTFFPELPVALRGPGKSSMEQNKEVIRGRDQARTGEPARTEPDKVGAGADAFRQYAEREGRLKEPTIATAYVRRPGREVADARVWYDPRAGAPVGPNDLKRYRVRGKAGQIYNGAKIETPDMVELPQSPEGAARFHDAITKAKATHGKTGQSVFVYDPADYEKMRLFLTDDGKMGFALKEMDTPGIVDIVSVFNSVGGPRKASYAMMRLAVELGGNTLDAFDIHLPRIYSANGFRVVSRMAWNDEFAPEGWDYDAFREFNGGRPDVVFMAYDKNRTDTYKKGEGALVDDYDRAVNMQQQFVLQGSPSLRRSMLSVQPAMSIQTKQSMGAAEKGLMYARSADLIANILNLKGYGLRKDKARRVTDSIIRKFQDNMLPVGRMIQELSANGLKITDAMDTYLQEELMHGKVGAMVGDRQKDLYVPVVNAIKRLNVPTADLDRLKRLSNDATTDGKGFAAYTLDNTDSPRTALADIYLYAKHAKERNKFIRDIRDPQNQSGSGMTDREADAILTWFNALPPDNRSAIEDMAKGIRAIVADTNRVRLEAGLISQDTIDKNPFRYYVPLRGVYDPDGDMATQVDEYRGPPGRPRLGARGKEDPMIKGRFDYASDLVANIFTQNQNAILRGERNKVGQSFLNLLRADPAKTSAYAEILKKRPMTRAVNAQGKNVEVVDFQAIRSPDMLVVKEEGRETFVRFSDVRLAGALNGQNGTGPATGNLVVKYMGLINRYLASINTSYNPEFMITNMFRDLQTAGVNVNQFEKEGITKDVLGGLRGALMGIRRSIRKEDDTSEWSRIYKDFVAAGGQNATNQFNSLSEEMAGIKTMLGDVANAGMHGKWNKVKHSFVGKGAGSLLRLVEDYNTVIENGIRVATYKALIDRGFTRERAAQAARNVTVNFAKGGDYRQFMNAFYLFYNASLQGSFALLNAAVRSPKVRRIWGAVMAVGILQDQLNAALSEEDDDGELVYDKIPAYVLEHNLILPDPFGITERSYISIPMPYGLNMAVNAGRSMSRTARGGYTPEQAVNSIFGTVLDTLNPIGGSESFFNFAAPTVLDPFVDMVENEDFANKPIYKESLPFDKTPSPDSQLHWSTTSPSSVWIAKNLNELTGGNAVRPGMIDVSPDTMEFWFEFLTGGVGRFVQRTAELPFNVAEHGLGDDLIRNVPLVRKAIGTVSDREDTGAYIERASKVLLVGEELKQAKETGDLQWAEETMAKYPEELKALPKVKAVENMLRKISRQMNEIAKNPRMAESQKKVLRERLEERRQQVLAMANRLLRDL